MPLIVFYFMAIGIGKLLRPLTDRAPRPIGRRRPGVRRRFLDGLPFPPDPFQLAALDSLDAGRSVLVSAPTGSGKTLVAAYAVRRALAAGRKAFYTTPLKALSNQKFGELAAEHGADRVGLLTGDIAVRPEAPVVVMTTEVLRNMLLAGSDLLEGLGTVVLDEVHYLQDPYRGGGLGGGARPLPARGGLRLPVGHRGQRHRARRLAALGAGPHRGGGRAPPAGAAAPPLRRGRRAARAGELGGTDLIPLLDEAGPAARACGSTRPSAGPPAADRPAQWPGGGPRLPYRTPRRTEIIEALDDEDLLPAIVFIFSRAACDDAVRQCLRDGLRLTDQHQRTAVRRIAEARTEGLTDDDLAVLGYPEWLEGLEAGVAAHHAGLVPAFREAVEACFAAGLLQVVFATETLSLGHQHAGPHGGHRAVRQVRRGRPGQPDLGGVRPAHRPGRPAGPRRGGPRRGALVARHHLRRDRPGGQAPPPDLRSSFRPTYNLAVNLVRRFDRPTATEVLRRSFAQWQATAHSERRQSRARRADTTTWSSTWAGGWPCSRSSATSTAGG